MLKYEIGQKVWFISSGKIVNSKITEREYKERNNVIGRFYGFKIYSDKREGDLFETEVDLLDHLSKTAEKEG